MTHFWVTDIERSVRIWLPGLRFQSPMQGEKIIFEAEFELHDIWLTALAFAKLLPSCKQIVERSYPMKKAFIATHPPSAFSSADIPIVVAVHALYRTLYKLSSKIGKRDRFGIYLKIEVLCLEIFSLSIEAALASTEEKPGPLRSIRIKVELLKHLIRTCRELSIFTDMQYIALQVRLQEISKMTAGWLKYATTPR